MNFLAAFENLLMDRLTLTPDKVFLNEPPSRIATPFIVITQRGVERDLSYGGNSIVERAEFILHFYHNHSATEIETINQIWNLHGFSGLHGNFRFINTEINYIGDSFVGDFTQAVFVFSIIGKLEPEAAPALPPIPPPQNFVITAPGGNQVILNWIIPAGLTDDTVMVIRRGTETLVDNLQNSFSSFSNPVNYDDNEGVELSYTIHYASGGRTSTELTETITIPEETPQAIDDFSVAIESTNSVIISWSVPAGAGAQSTWTLCRGTTVLQENILRTAATSLSYVDAGLTPGQSYNYKLSYTEDGTESPIARASISIPHLPIPSVQNFVITAPGGNEIILNWENPTDLPTAAVVEIRQGANILVDNLQNSITTYTHPVDYDDNEGASFPYTIRYLVEDRRGPTTTETILIPEEVPQEIGDFSVAVENVNSIRITWTVPAGAGAQSTWTLCRGLVPIQENIPTTTETSLSYLDTGLMPGQNYNYKISYTEDGTESPIATAAIMIPFPPIPVPGNFIITALGGNQVVLSWERPASLEENAVVVVRQGTNLLTNNLANSETSFTHSVNYDNNEGVDFVYTIQYAVGTRTSPVATQSITIPTTAPQAITDFTAVLQTSNSVILSWSVPVGAGAQSTWTLRRGTTIIQENIPRTSAATATFLDTNLVPGTSYNYQISYTEDGAQSPIASASVSIPHLPIPEPTNFVITAPGSDEVILNWNRPTGLQDAAVVVVRQGTTILTNTLMNSVTTYTHPVDYDDNEGVELTYTIQYVVGDREGSSISQSITIPIQEPQPVDDLTATVENGNNIRLSWSVPAGAGAQSTWTLRRGTTIIQENIATGDAISLSYLDTGLTEGQTYTYTISFREDGVTAAPATVSAAVPLSPIPDPQDLTLMAPGGNEVILSWTRPASLPANAVVSIYEGTNLLTNNLESSTTTFTHSVNYDDNEGVELSYTVQFSVGARTSQIASQTITIPITAPQRVTGFSAVLENFNNVRLSWNVPVGAGAQSTWTLIRNGVTVQENIPRTSDTTVTYLDENVPFGVARYFITYTEDGQTSPLAGFLIVLQVPPTSAPENFAISLPGSDQVVLTWTNPENYDTDNLRIEIFVDGTGDPTTLLTDTLLYSATTFTHNFNYDEHEGFTLYYRIRYQTPERTRESTQISESIMIPITNPEQINDLTAVVENGNNVRLSWSVPTGAGAQSRWTLCRGTTILQENILRTDATSLSYLDEGLTQGESYTYKLFYREDGVEAPAANISITIPATGPNLGPVDFTDFTTRRSLSSGVRFSYDAFTPFTEDGMALPMNWVTSALFVGIQLRTNNNHRIYLPGLQPTDFFLTRQLRISVMQAGTTHVFEGPTTFTNSNEAGFSATDSAAAATAVTAIRSAFSAADNITVRLELI